MKVFNEEPLDGKKPQEFILIIDSKEALSLLEMTAVACNQSPKKAAWKKIKAAFEERIACF